MKNITILLFLLLTSCAVNAHEVRPVIATLTLIDAKHYELDIKVNAEALLARIDSQHSDTSESPNAAEYDQLRALNPITLQKKFDNYGSEYANNLAIFQNNGLTHPQFIQIDVPKVGDTRGARTSIVHFKGELIPSAQEIRWQYPADYGDSVFKIGKIHSDYQSEWLKDGKKSNPFVLEETLNQVSKSTTALDYTILGFQHIIPKGIDHILFVLGIFLLSIKWRPLLYQVTAFTLAHTITLGLSIYGFIALSPSIVEPLIAASIVYVAVENIYTPDIKPWRVLLVFCFGLLHGLGFAGVLNEIGLPESEFLVALITFNVGVELGQLSVIVIAFFSVAIWCREKIWYRQVVVIPSSLMIALVGSYWTVERIVG